MKAPGCPQQLPNSIVRNAPPKKKASKNLQSNTYIPANRPNNQKWALHLPASRVLEAASSGGISKGIPVWPLASHTLARGVKLRSGILPKVLNSEATGWASAAGRPEDKNKKNNSNNNDNISNSRSNYHHHNHHYRCRSNGHYSNIERWSTLKTLSKTTQRTSRLCRSLTNEETVISSRQPMPILCLFGFRLVVYRSWHWCLIAILVQKDTSEDSKSSITFLVTVSFFNHII